MTTRNLLVIGVLSATLLAGCGYPDINGAAGVTVDEQHNPVLILAVCRGAVEQVTVHGPLDQRHPDRPNPELGAWSNPHGSTQAIRIPLAGPNPEGWTTTKALPLPLQAGQTYIVTANSHQGDNGEELRQVDFKGQELALLTPGQVLRDPKQGSRVTDETTFLRAACPPGG